MRIATLAFVSFGIEMAARFLVIYESHGRNERGWTFEALIVQKLEQERNVHRYLAGPFVSKLCFLEEEKCGFEGIARRFGCLFERHTVYDIHSEFSAE